MEKSRAIELLKLAVPIKALTQQEYADFVEAVNMGMDALEQPTSPDTIDRQAVIKVLECWQKAFKENSHHASASDLSLVVKDIRALSATHVATDTNVGDKISKFINGLEEIFADIRERHVDDSVCGLCEYDGAYMGQSGDWCNECPGFDRDDCFKLSNETRKKWTDEIIKALPTVQPEERTEKRMETHACDLISKQEVLDALDCINGVEEVLRSLPPAYSDENNQEFIKLTVRYSNGRPYYSIIYLEYDKNGVGHDFEGYSSYSLDVISDYLKKYFMPFVQPETKEGEWIIEKDEHGVTRGRCPKCGMVQYAGYTNFCPNCGAKMKGKRQK